jgi:hypothetical protein
MSNQELAGRVTRILSDAWSQKIKFTLCGCFTNLRVEGYQLVVDAIARGKITCEVGVPPNPNLRAGTHAECRYTPDNRQLHFPNAQYGSIPGRETFNIVHEATHAAFDCRYGNPAGTQILAMDDEAGAFFAQAVYSRISTYSWNGPIPEGDPIYEALKLADRIMQRHGRVIQPPYWVPEPDLDQLLLSIQRPDQYDLQGGKAGIMHTYYGLP